ncbi:MAG TPA: DinB family protein [Acidobacteriota bacterium]
MSLVEEAIRNWESYRKGVIAELENIPEEHWDHCSGAGARTLRELARHIAEAGLGFTTELVRPDCSFLRLFDPQAQAQHKAVLSKANSKAEIVNLLRTTGEQGARRLREVGDALATQNMKTSTGEQSRLTGLWFAAAHEMYHRGQLASYARAVGCVPALTQQIEGMLAGSQGSRKQSAT